MYLGEHGDIYGNMIFFLCKVLNILGKESAAEVEHLKTGEGGPVLILAIGDNIITNVPVES